MRQQEQVGERETALRAAINGKLKSVWTSLPGVVTAFNPSNMTVSVQPTIQGVITDETGGETKTDLPLLVDVPVQFPQGGNCIMTFPISPGDECLVVFASRHIDAWWQSGGVQAPMSARMHNLSDGMAVMGFHSVPRVPVSINTGSVQLRDTSGSTSITLDPNSQMVEIKAPGGLNIIAPIVNVNGQILATGDVKAANISLLTHRHLGVSTGSGTSGTPTP